MDKWGRIARRIVFAEKDSERVAVLSEAPAMINDRLAFAIRDVCYEEWSARPVNVRKAATAIRLLSCRLDSPVVRAIMLWIDAISNVVAGRFEKANALLNDASEVFCANNLPTEAAKVQVAQLLTLAMLGRYDDAVATGKAALRTFIAQADAVSAGKVELNLSNILARQARHRESLKFCSSASRRFLSAHATSWYAMAENGLANTYADLNVLDRAEAHYNSALAAAKSEKMDVTVAEIEACIGFVALGRGQYTKALQFIESSRHRYDTLGMPHQSAIADLEIADIYVELNLLDAAAQTLAGLPERFRSFKMRAEEAKTLLLRGRVCTMQGKSGEARRALSRSKKLFEAEKNIGGALSTCLAMLDIETLNGSTKRATDALDEAEHLLKLSQNPRHKLHALRAKGQHAMRSNDLYGAEMAFRSALQAASRMSLQDEKRAIFNDLGLVAKLSNKNVTAKRYLTRSIEIAERLHLGIGNDQFGMAFLASRLEPVKELVSILIDERKVTRSFQVLERGRSRTLLNSFITNRSLGSTPRRLGSKLAEIRSELNQLYKRSDRSASENALLVQNIRSLETELEAIELRVQGLAIRTEKNAQNVPFDVGKLQKQLGPSRALIEFLELDGRYGAYLISASSVRFYRELASTEEISRLIGDLHFQFSTFRYGISERFAAQIRERIERTLRSLHDLLFSSFDVSSSVDSLLIVPVGALYYVPFGALFDGLHYLVERFEISLSPSAAIWQKLNQKRNVRPRSALLMGLPDESIPFAEHEIASISSSIQGPEVFLSKKASIDIFRKKAPHADIVHLACHGQFRPDNPMFSSLKLSDGWVTVGDLTSLRLKASLVTLSACETGQSKIFPGDEILGLARGFLAAGASTIVASLWAVNDETTASLMRSFYEHLSAGLSPARSLCRVQNESIECGIDVYYWAPFFAIGR